MPTYGVRLLNRKEIAYETMAFEFERPNGFDFRAGQFLELFIKGEVYNGQGKSKEFSIASAPEEQNLMIAMRMRGSGFKNFLRSVPLGTNLKIKGPYGSLALPAEAKKPIVFLAGGIGITLFRSMVKQATYENPSHKISLFYSNRRPEDAPFLNELNDLRLTTNNFKFIPTMTKLNESKSKWTGERGYINMEMLKRHIDSPTQALYYIAGPPAFTAAMWQVVKLVGVNEDSVRTEEFAGY